MSNAPKETATSTAVGAVKPLPTVLDQDGGTIAETIHPPNPGGDTTGQAEGLFATPKTIHPPNGGDGP
jgi:hypothetical protein